MTVEENLFGHQVLQEECHERVSKRLKKMVNSVFRTQDQVVSRVKILIVPETWWIFLPGDSLQKLDTFHAQVIK